MHTDIIDKNFETIEVDWQSDSPLGAMTIRLNRPEAKNAISDTMMDELNAVLDAVAEDRAVRSIVLRGNAGVFCAGGDLKWFRSDMQATMSATEVAASNRTIGYLLSKINRQPQVVIALVEGAAIGGGLGLVCSSDLAIVTEQCKFRLSETSLGIPPAQIAPFVTERIGAVQARRLMLTGARLQGAEAVELGIAQWLVEDSEALEARCQAVLTDIANCAPGANAATKAIIHDTLTGEREAVLDAASARFAECMLGDEASEGLSAFVEKRKPSWSQS